MVGKYINFKKIILIKKKIKYFNYFKIINYTEINKILYLFNFNVFYMKNYRNN